MAHPHIILQEKHTVTSLSQLRQCLSTSSQPQCNKWVNGGAVPSSEADSRAFSFDIIPSSQIDNLTIVKDAKDGKFKLQNVYFAGMDAVGTDANKQYEDYLYDAVQKKDIDKNQKSYSNTFFFAEQSNKYFDSWTSLVGADGYTPSRKPIARCRKFRWLDRFRHSNLHRSLRWQHQMDERLDQLRPSECKVLEKEVLD